MSRHRAYAAVGLALLAAASTGERAGAAPQTFNTALPVAKGEFIFREEGFYAKASDDPSPANREVEVLGSVYVLGYGMTPDLAVFGALPILDKELDLTTPSGERITRDASGIGDARLFARYTAFRDDAPGRTFRVAPFLGIELPTGKDDERDSLGRLPQPLQLGSGSWDPFGGVVATWQTLDYQVDVQAAYELNTEANDFEFGDQARLDASLQYRLWPRELGEGVPGFLYGVIEANLADGDENAVGGVEDPNSGGTTFHLSPGIQYVTPRWIVEGIVQIPVTQELGGDAVEEDRTIRVGFRVNF